jgi:cobyrinic acid a,c-diamide synthase
VSARVLVIAGTASGVGKTTVTLGLLEAYRRRGLVVQAFKVGPDFIDAGLHTLVTGRPCYNLDGWMCGREHGRATVARHSADADLVIVEGVMGCFDGTEAAGDEGATAQVAKWLGAPLLLVLDASALAGTAAAVVHGFETFDPELRVAAVIANRVAGAAHARMVAEALRRHCRAAPVGALVADGALTLPERHLGLVTAAEGALTATLRARLADAIESSVDLDRLLALAAPLSRAGFAGAARPGRSACVRIGVARDAAFQFYYEENLERLQAAGAELVFWSPLADATLPTVDGLYFGGGYPELHARTLADNAGALKAVLALAAAGTPIYAECGGLMYLAEALEDMDGVPHRMVGLLPATVRMRPRRLTLGYREVRFSIDTPLGPEGTVARGHEFHCSTLDVVPASVTRAYRPVEGYLVGRTLLSYVHLHFGSNPALARNFVAACEAGRRC